MKKGGIKAENEEIKTENGNIKTENGNIKTTNGGIRTENGGIKTTMNNDWTNDIRKLMDGYEAKAPDGLLDEVKRKMAAQTNHAAQHNLAVQSVSTAQSSDKASRGKAKVAPLWRYRWIAAAAAVAVIAVPIFWKLMPSNQDLAINAGKKGPASSHIASSSTVTSASSSSPSSSSPSSETSVSSSDGSVASSASIALSSSESPTSSPSSESPASSSVDNEGRVSRNNVAAPTEKQHPTPRMAKKRTQASEPLYALAYNEPAKRAGGAFSVGAYYGGTTGNNGGGSSMDYILSDAAPYGPYPADMATARVPEPKRDAHHKQPIKAGVSVSYRLNNRWSVQSGVTYSYLSSDFTSDKAPKETQKLHYVGVPLTASYNIVKGRKAEIYVTAGGEVEKLVKGKSSTENHEDKDIKEHRPQWSVKAAVGGAYHFTPTVSVYVEPGVSHHFDNHSAVENIYKDKPTNFSLNMGFRVDLNKK